MDAGSSKLLYDLVEMGATSLLHYLSGASLYSTNAAAIARVKDAAREERDEIARFIRLLQRNHQYIPKPGSFPSHFTTMNFVTLEYVLPKLIAEQKREIAKVASMLDSAGAEDIRKLGDSYLAMKRRHLQMLEELAHKKPAAA